MSNFIELLYAFAIAPLQGAMQLVLEWAHQLTGSWGWSIVLLSLAVNLALIPVYHLAESWQEDERNLQKRMSGKLAEVKAVYTGRERYMFIRAVYRMFGYHPLMALRTSLGLLIQIPFFFAAYSLLHNNPSLDGVSFFFIPNLGQPDGLLQIGGLGLNLLPFVMTGVNLLSAAVYSARLSRKDKIQLYGLAALFLLLLYTAAAGLLLYWTCNNIFSCCKNLFYKNYVYEDSRRELPGWLRGLLGIRALPGRGFASVAARLPGWADLPLAAAGVTLLILAEAFWRKKFFLEIMIPCAALIWLSGAVRMNFARRSGNALLRNSGWLFLLLSVFVGILLALSFSSLKYATPRAAAYSLFYAASVAGAVFWAFSRQPLCWLVEFLHVRASAAMRGRDPKPLYFGSAMLMGLLIFIYEPAGLFSSDPSLFFEPMPALFGSLLFKAGVFWALTFLVWSRADASVRPLLTITLVWWALCMAVYALAVLVDYGPMDGPTLSEWEVLYRSSNAAIDAGVLLGVLALVLILGMLRRLASLSGVLQGLSGVICLLSLWNLFTAPAQTDLLTREDLNRPPRYSERLFSFNAEKNIVVFMLDSFTGEHLKVIFSEDPDLGEKYQGFTWYSDTLAPGNSTVTSVPQMLGGQAFSPQEASARADRPLRDRAQEAYAVLPNILLEEGYDVAMVNVEMLDPADITAYCPRFSEVTYASTADYAFINPWRLRNGMQTVDMLNQSGFMSAFGVFKVAPLSLRRHIYRQATWLQTYKIGRDSSEGGMAMLDLMAELSHVNQEKPTFKYLSSMLPHHPWQLDADCKPSASLRETRRPDGLTAEYINAERCSLKFVAQWLDWLRENELYDKTRVIIISDHSYGDSAPAGVPGRQLRSNALLLVKDFGDDGPLRTDERPMSSGDLQALVCREGEQCAGLEYFDPLAEEGLKVTERTRYHFRGHGFLLRRHPANRFNGTLHRVQGPQSDAASWQVEKVYE